MNVRAADPRQERGLALLRAKKLGFRHIVGGKYLVPSATGSADYVVDVDARRCTCPDFEERALRCKHLWAVSYLRNELEMPSGTTVVTESVQTIRPTYSQNWPAYNRAQCEEKETVQILLRALCEGIVQPAQALGRPRLALRDTIYAATMKVYGTMSGRRSTTDIRACEEDGHIEHAPSYNSIFRYVERADLMPLLKALVDESATPLRAIETAFAGDATGFSTSTYGRWFDSKYGAEKSYRRFVKLHAMCGTFTNVLTAVEATEASVADSLMFAKLVTTTAANGFKMAEVSADKAYLSHANLAAVESFGAVPYIPFKENSKSAGSAAWTRMFHLYSLHKEEFLERYHRRSNIETCFSSIKRKFGGSVRNKLLAAQLNEVLLKCLCHNLSCLVHSIHELGVEPKFWQPSPPAVTT